MWIKALLLAWLCTGFLNAEPNFFPLNFTQIEQDEELLLDMLNDVKVDRLEALEQMERDFLIIQKLAIEAEDRRIAEALRIKEEKRIAAELERLRLEEVERKRIAEEERIAEEKRLALEKIRLEKIRAERARTRILAKVNIKKQRVRVYRGGNLIHTWKVSTGKKGFTTPKGEYQPIFMKKMHYSKQYAGAPMPYAIFFHKGYALHGTKSTRRLGRRASHGCVRLRTSNAKKLFRLVQQSGKYNANIIVN
jgi:lipoprotein-anchoring transpeptidase ErfK/SrfK